MIVAGVIPAEGEIRIPLVVELTERIGRPAAWIGDRECLRRGPFGAAVTLKYHGLLRNRQAVRALFSFDPTGNTVTPLSEIE